MLTNTFYLFILIPFILGFITYGIRKLIHPPLTTHTPVTIELPATVMKQLQEYGYLDPNTQKLKEEAIGLVTLKEEEIGLVTLKEAKTR